MPRPSINVRGSVEYRDAQDTKACSVQTPDPFALVVFGASGDLARRKIVPAVYRLWKSGLLPGEFVVLGTGRAPLTDEDFRVEMRKALAEYLEGGEFDEAGYGEFAAHLCYQRLDYGRVGDFEELGRRLRTLEGTYKTRGNYIFYLAVPPSVYEDSVVGLGNSGLFSEERGYTHLVVEKPFGRDLESAVHLNGVIRNIFAEHQVYRMDHYLAKETVQNLLVFRFGNSIFEPLWNRRYIDHVQITVAEEIGVGHRAGYYESAGVMRDMFQNHLLQLVALTAMEPPSTFKAERVRDEKVKVLSSIRPFPLVSLHKWVALGQYGPGLVGGATVPGYRDEEDVAAGSTTPTYCALKLYVDNWRFNGVPFYLRSGKRLPNRKAEVTIHFKEVPHQMFADFMPEAIEPNVLVLRLQPDEGINLSFQTKRPGSRPCMSPVEMDFSYPDIYSLEAYERVLLDCMQGEQMLFVRRDGVEASWGLLSPVIERLEDEATRHGVQAYAAGSSGPESALELILRDGRHWRTL